VCGLLLGQCPDARPMAGRTLRETVVQVLGDYTFPIVAEMSFGHGDPMLTLPNGCLASIDAVGAGARVTLLESAVTVDQSC
jgi:muramoyltetrapeptide carboxypeptidase